MEELFERWLAEVPTSCAPTSCEPVDLQLAVPGEHNRRNAAAALAALELAGVDREEAAKHLAEFVGAGRRLELRGEAGGVRVLDDYAHHPAEMRATVEAVRDGTACSSFSSRTSTRARVTWRTSSARRSRRPTSLP